jgi:hypothetical protein
MKALTPGHRYELDDFENAGRQVLQFIHKEPEPLAPDPHPGPGRVPWGQNLNLRTVSDGTTNEEVLRMLIDRMQFLQSKFPCRENALVITKLEESLMWLEKRTADRVARGVEGQQKA